jgi:hypothetical protein
MSPHVKNFTNDPIDISWCINSDHWSGSPGVHDDGADGHTIVTHTIVPGESLIFDNVSQNSNAITNISSNVGLTSGE